MTRADLADALEGATVATMREDAKLLAVIAGNLEAQVDNIRHGSDDTPATVIPILLENAAMHRRAAAALLALAEMADGDARVEQALTGGDYLCIDVPITGHNYGATALLPALAALVRGT